MVRTGSVINIVDILDRFKRQISFLRGADFSHAWLAILIYILRFCEDITIKTTLIIIFNK